MLAMHDEPGDKLLLQVVVRLSLLVAKATLLMSRSAVPVLDRVTS